MDSAIKLLNSVDETLDHLGVETCLILIRDPDSGQIVSVKRGDSLWLWGAVNAAEEAIRSSWRLTREDA